ncbi:MAG: DUF5662 family protein [Planctomycetia bacterium]|nr:DUF5662 family protein [Planctomycetia bacterium]
MSQLTPRQRAKVIRNALRVHRLSLDKHSKWHARPRRLLALYALVLSRNYWQRAWAHFKLITKHKSLVFCYCVYAGMPWRGIMHDWSKYSPSEFFESIRYFNGRRSPVGMAREVDGYSYAWLHHKGRNRHHFEFWQDVVSPDGRYVTYYGEIFPLPMPYPFLLESICDTIAASRAYNGKHFSYQVLYDWWTNKLAGPKNMFPDDQEFANQIYEEMKNDGNCSALRRAKAIYDRTHQL